VLTDTMEEARRKFEELHITSEDKMAALYALQAEKDEEVIPNFYFLTQITNALHTSRELEDKLSDLKQESIALEADSKNALDQALREAELKVSLSNSQLISDHGDT
jgi:hypothetical protein